MSQKDIKINTDNAPKYLYESSSDEYISDNEENKLTGHFSTPPPQYSSSHEPKPGTKIKKQILKDIEELVNLTD